MNDKEFADYLEADIETRYEIHKAAYFKQYPESNIEKFHRFETAYLKRQIEKYNTKETVAIKETEIHINQIEVLEYIQNLKIAPLDYRFSINSDFWEQERTKLELASFQSKINNEGFLNVEVEKETVKIYNPQLAVILTSNELPAKDLDTQAETTIDSWEYLKTFVAAYKEGEQYFETTFKVSPEIMFGAGAKNYVNEIHMNFFHLQHRMNEGWVYVKKAEPLILTHKAVKEYGYYSGLVNKVEQLIIEYPRLFAAFEKCEHNMQPQQVETKTDKLTAPTLGFFCGLINKIGIDKKNETESATVYCIRICEKFKLPYKERVRQSYNVNETKKLNKELIEKVLPLIDNETKILIEKYLDSKQPTKQNLYA